MSLSRTKSRTSSRVMPNYRFYDKLSKLNLDVISVIATTLPSYELYPFINRKLNLAIPRLKEVIEENSKYYWNIQKFHSVRPFRYKKNYATIYLVNLNTIKEYIYKSWDDGEYSGDDEIDGLSYNDFDENDVTISMINKVYPTLVYRLDRGDIIEFIDVSGYRSQGIVFFDGEKLINQCTKYDDYGSLPIEFGVITEFPPDYFKKAYMATKPSLPVINDYVSPKDKSEFYWHSNECTMALHIKELKIAEKIKMVLQNTIDKDRYVFFTYNKLKVLLILDYDFRHLSDDTEYILVRNVDKHMYNTAAREYDQLIDHKFGDDLDYILSTDWW